MRKWPTSAPSGFITLPSGGSPMLSSGGQNQKWLPHPGLLGAQKRVELLCKPCVRVGTQQRGQNQKWPTSGFSGYITPTLWGVPDASERGTKSEMAASSCLLGGPK